MDRKPQFTSDGVHHATINGHRFHLRTLDPTSDNFLWVDGQQPPLVLDPTAAEFMRHLIDAMWEFQQGDGDESEQVINYVLDQMHSAYPKILRAQLRKDLDKLYGLVLNLTHGACPAALGLEGREIRYADWLAPARMDLALTYRCNLKCRKCYNGDSPSGRELSTRQWLSVYETLWSVGIPQIVFTGGEPTLRTDIIQLVSEADEFVTGLITNGTQLEFLAEPLKRASLDYVQISVESYAPTMHDVMTGISGSHTQTTAGIKKALEVGLSVVTNTTLTRDNASHFVQTLGWLRDLEVRNMACNTLICSGKGTKHRAERGLSDVELVPVLRDAIAFSEKHGLNLQWYSPTCYNNGINPLDLGFGPKSCSAAAHNMTVQPDGTVLPCQSWPNTVGNILTDNWNDIWNHPTCVMLRERTTNPGACSGCQFETECGGGCPLDTTSRTCNPKTEEK